MTNSDSAGCGTSDKDSEKGNTASTPPSNLAATSVDKETVLSQAKLKLEIEALEANQKYKIEFLKALATPIAIIGFCTTFVLGIIQLNQTARVLDDKPFDTPVPPLAPPTPTQRLTAASSS